MLRVCSLISRCTLVGVLLVPAARAGLALPHPFDLTTLDGANGAVFEGIDHDDLAAVGTGGAGDFDGDGFEEVLIGARLADPNGMSQAGEVYLLPGRGGLPGSPLSLASIGTLGGVTLEGGAVDDLTGVSVSGLGDFDGDGLDDFAIGAMFRDAPGRFDAGGVYILRSTRGPLGVDGVFSLAAVDGINGVTVIGASTEFTAAHCISGAGDMNGDGLQDLLIGVPMERSSGIGQAAVVFGSASPGSGGQIDLATLDGTDGFTLRGFPVESRLGARVGGAGDINGDGYADVVVGGLIADPGGRTDAGQAFVVYGGPSVGASGEVDLTALDGTDGVRIDGLAAGDLLGAGVGGAGDVNGDGFGDLILGAVFASPLGRAQAGEAYLICGAEGGIGSGGTLDLASLAGSHDIRLLGRAAGDWVGNVATGVGDVNGDGFADFLLGAPHADPLGLADAGEVYLIWGSAEALASGGVLDLNDLDGTNGVRLHGDEAGAWLGVNLSGAGDFNGDGIHDMLLGAAFADQGTQPDAGEGYLVLGVEGSPSATCRAFVRSGAAAPLGIGLPGNGSTSLPATRVSVGFDAGTGPHTLGASLVEVDLTRGDPGVTGLGAVAPARWEIAADRTGWAEAQLVIRYTPAEAIAAGGAPELWQAPSPSGPWMRVASQTRDDDPREIRARVNALGSFILVGEPATAAERHGVYR